MPARGRPKRYAEFDAFYAALPAPMEKRPRYLSGVGVFRGQRNDTAWIKIRLPHGGTYRGKRYQLGSALEIKAGNLTSWTWHQLVSLRDEMQGKADRNEPLEDEVSPTFGEWAEDWLGRARQRVKSFQTVEIHVRRHLLPFFGQSTLPMIVVADVNRWIARQLEINRPGTVKRQFNTLRAILNDAVRAGTIETNPCSNADPIRGLVARQRFLSAEELLLLLVEAANVAEWLPDFILWAIHSGMRRAEILGLRWEDVRKLDDGRVLASIETTKADQPRMIPCTRTMCEVLERQRGRMQEGSEKVFPIALMTLRRKWEAARRSAGLEDVTIHDLRRTHGTHAAAAGVDLRTLADRIGHTDLTMLQRHYAAVVGSAAIEAADTFQSVFDRMVAPKAEPDAGTRP